MVHAPTGDFASLIDWCGYETVIIYRAKPGQLALLVVSRNFTQEDFIKHMPVIAPESME